MDYDSGKFSVDVSDQLAFYNTALRRCTKWYRKLINEVIWGTALVNAYFLYTENTVSSNKLSSSFVKKLSVHLSVIIPPVMPPAKVSVLRSSIT